MTVPRKLLAGLGLMLATGAAFAATPLGRDLSFHLVPLAWTGEAERLARAAGIGPGDTVADVGAGKGELIVELAKIVGPAGRALATERTEALRQAIARRARAAGTVVTLVEAGEHTTSLPDTCCDAITLRMVWHHIADPSAFARDLRRAVRGDGRVAVVDFPPGALPHLTADHGVSADVIITHFTAAGFDLELRDDRWGGRTYLIMFRRR